MDLAGKNILIVGFGMSGIATARFAKNKGASVTISDMASEKELAPNLSAAQELGVNMEFGQHTVNTFERADLIVISPGVPHTILPIQHAKAKGVPVLGEVELAARYIREPIVAISGTNGKTTTTTLLGNMLKNSGFKVFVGGNIGNPLINYLNQREPAEIVVAEVSSFQLDTIDTFRPRVGVLLNIKQDHMDRYPDFKAYVASKGRIFENQKEGDIAVINEADPAVRSIGNRLKSRKLHFFYNGNFHSGVLEGAAITRGNSRSTAAIVIQTKEAPKRSLDLSRANLQGMHNIENAAAASLAALAIGGTFEGVQSAVDNFQGLSHRLEHIATINDIQFFDDSKATNVDAVVRALEAFEKPVVLIMGGRDKGGNFEVLNGHVRQHTKKLILMGEAKDNIQSVLRSACKGGTQTANTMKDAVLLAYQAADPGDVVLLSPACSSFDMYGSYAERGEDFSRAVGYIKALS